MAGKEEDGHVDTDTEFMTQDEQMKLIEAFKSMNLKPDTSNLMTWMKTLVDSDRGGALHKIKTEVPSMTTQASSLSSQSPSSAAPPVSPAQPDTPSVTSFPKLSTFFGAHSQKGEATYEQWRYEVKCLLQQNRYSTPAILDAVRRSLKGEAKNIVVRMGFSASIDDILAKFESVYGCVEGPSNILAKFYSAKQESDEDVSAWSLRLEQILSEAIQLGQVEPQQSSEMLRTKFYNGLRQSLREISGHKYDTIHDFDLLRVEIRKLEQQHESRVP